MKPLICLTVLLFITMQSNAQLKARSYTDGAQKLNGLAIGPSGQSKSKGGILILPAWKGIDQHSKNVALELSKLGYHVFIADIYGEENYPTDVNSAGKMAGYYKSHIDEYRKRISLALEQLVKTGATPSKIVAIGYCFGGTGVLEAARANFPIRGVVSFHGGLDRDTSKAIVPIKPEILVCHGADDPFVPPTQVASFQQEMRDAKADWQMIYYANSVHAFTEPEAGNDSKGAAYNEKADKRSWQHFMLFLKEVLKGD
ncbi:dienelactone hydrolase family protein [Pedobacter nyackensis]|uniref:Dienelactone hydrolase n=1 Tax=Pedobacter nyackensis TaxID=475255 RepID=A0A1W2EM22_9SPHI|nr:dienelactone hydrolase family protein [Pedobacter nyackensis]SMD10723.1 Dienelactone hydrolase [Pedobacter nyackensis]